MRYEIATRFQETAVASAAFFTVAGVDDISWVATLLVAMFHVVVESVSDMDSGGAPLVP